MSEEGSHGARAAGPGGLPACFRTRYTARGLVAAAAVLVLCTIAWPLLDPVLGLALASISWQRPTHALPLGAGAMPVEARMLGIFGGLATALATLAFRRGSIPTGPLPLPSAALAVAGVCATGLDGANAVLADLAWPHLYEPQTWLRLTTGTAAGAGLALWLAPAFAPPGTRAAPSWPRVAIVMFAAEAVFVAMAVSAMELPARAAVLAAALGVVGSWAGANLLLISWLSRRVPSPGACLALGLAEALLAGALRTWLQSMAG